jgi:cell wall-associated NlpC family hydrolase
MTTLDRRFHPFRDDLSAEYLRGQVETERFVPGRRCQVSSDHVPLRRTPDPAAVLDTELLFGETVQLYDERNGWAWIQSEVDGYVGYAESQLLTATPLEPSHSVAVLATHLYPKPDLKAAPIGWLPMTARVNVGKGAGVYSNLTSGGWIYAAHLAPIGVHATDHCEVAQKFLDCPYLWGGKTSTGIDCSGLLQVSLARCDKEIPRDSDMQTRAGTPVKYEGDDRVLRRGDLVFWPGHAGIWIDSQSFIHANAANMLVTIEPLDRVAARIEAASGDSILCVQRI